MAEQNLKFGDASEEQKEVVLSKMRQYGIMLPNIEQWGYTKVVARVDELVKQKIGDTPAPAVNTEENSEDVEDLAEDKSDVPQEIFEQNSEHDVENDEVPAPPEPPKHYDGLCHICRSAVYDGTCTGCGFTLNR